VSGSASRGPAPSLSISLAARARAIIVSVSSAVCLDLTLELDVRRNLDEGGEARSIGEAAIERRSDPDVGEDVTSACGRFLG
jgi:hypothetical protein